MKKINFLRTLAFIFLSIILSLQFSACTSSWNTSKRIVAEEDEGNPAPPPHAYDRGPDLSTEMGRELNDIMASIPDFRTVSGEVMTSQKFRYFFGPVMWRMLQDPNSIRILFIGQDATHIAEAANRPATAGYGGRLQDLAEYFGIKWSLACINTFAGTIYGQYAFPDTPVIHKDGEGKFTVRDSAVVENTLWLISQDPNSPIVKWRNRLIDWIIRNNHDSLQMVVTFGGAARDTMATYLQSKGAKVGTKTEPESLKSDVVPRLISQSTGGNGEIGVPYSHDGKIDLYAEAYGKRVNYKKPEEVQKAKDAFAKAIAEDPEKWMKLIDPKMGVEGSGIINPAQIRGFDLDNQLFINGQKTDSMKGLVVGGKALVQDIPIVALPHPTVLSGLSKEKAAAAVKKSLERIIELVRRGWRIKHDKGFSNHFANGEDYEYGRGTMSKSHYDWGTPKSRMVAVSSASRMDASTIVFGTRDRVTFDENLIQQMKDSAPSDMPDEKELFNMHGRLSSSRGVFDPGPGDKYAKIMFDNVPEELRESHSVNGDFSHYRGTFKYPKVIVLADPSGYDDLITSRALTGARGQYIHGMLDGLGYGDKYLVLNTAPFSLDRNGVRDFRKTVAKTFTYREELLRNLLADGTPDFILADGRFALKEMERLTELLGIKVPVISMRRSKTGANFKIEETIRKIKERVPKLKDKPEVVKMKDIPRSHLCYVARIWEGTGGDRVITSTDPKYAGIAFAEVVPDWAARQQKIHRTRVEILRTEVLKAIKEDKPFDHLLSEIEGLESISGERIFDDASLVAKESVEPEKKKRSRTVKLDCASIFQ